MNYEETQTGATLKRAFTLSEVAEFNNDALDKGMRRVYMDGYTGYWESAVDFVLQSYCEGDVVTIYCDNEDQFKAEQKRRDDWLDENK